MSLQAKSDRGLFRRAERIFCLAVLLLAVCVCVQAVHAKASHYAGHTPQSLHFSASVKIAKFVPVDVVAPQVAAIPVPFRTLQEPRITEVAYVVKPAPVEIFRPTTAILLRSPPVVS
jgi:hypothetical protein